MRRDAVLAAARTNCLQMFASLLAGLGKRSADKAFAMAYKTTNFTEHRLFLDAFSALNNRADAIEQQLHSNLSMLLGRSIQIAYNPRRASAMLEGGADAWSLVDATAIDTEIRLQKISGLFHARSGEDIRTLNLRIAALFDQEAVKERENPFRPYLFSRAILESISDLRLPPDVTEVINEQIATELVDGVAEIYHALNAYFESQGVPARLIVKPMPSTAAAESTPRKDGSVKEDEGRTRVTNALFAQSPGQSAMLAEDSRSVEAAYSAQAAPALPKFVSSPGDPYGMPPPRKAKLEQLLHMVRKKAGRSGTQPDAIGGFSSGADAAVGASAVNVQARGEAGGFPGGERTPIPAMQEGWMGSGQIARDTLQALFAERESIGPALAVPAAFVRTPVFHHLQQAYVPATVELVDSAGEVRNLIFESRASLQSKASGADEMMTIDVVGMIFEFILRDTQVPAEIRAQLGRLQFHLLKIALVEPQLLSQKDHPARRLINRIGTVSAGLKPNEEFVQPFTAEVKRIVEAMLADESGSTELVSRLSDEFESFVADHLRSRSAKVEHAVEAIEVAERRSVYFSRLKAELGKIFMTLQADPYLKEFIESAWLGAIEKAEHQDAQLGGRYRALVPELIWSVLGKPNERERSRLLTHLPQMLFDLKAGLGAIRYQERQAFLSWLVESHTAAIKGSGFRPDQPSLSALRKQFHAFIEITSRKPVDVNDAGAAFDRRFIRDAAEELNLKLDEIETVMEFGGRPDAHQGADAAASSSSADPDKFSNDDVLDRLRVGVPVEVNVDGAPRKATLNWLNASATNMVLSFENKDAPTTISVSLFRRLLANERARFVEALPVFERAVSALLEAADRVDEIFL